MTVEIPKYGLLSRRELESLRQAQLVSLIGAVSARAFRRMCDPKLYTKSELIEMYVSQKGCREEVST